MARALYGAKMAGSACSDAVAARAEDNGADAAVVGSPTVPSLYFRSRGTRPARPRASEEGAPPRSPVRFRREGVAAKY